MNILVINSGSSSLKFQLINVENEEVVLNGHVDGIGLDTCEVKIDGKSEQKDISNHTEAVKIVLDSVDGNKIDAIGHRVVHGGTKYDKAVLIDDSVIKQIEELCDLAPLHNPVNLKGIIACREVMPEMLQVAVFDTAFHQTIPKETYMYGVPLKYYENYGVRKYGFHGTNHKYITECMENLLRRDSVNIISCHLGNGASIAAIRASEVVDTSMGFTPVAGLMMGTRSGDVDAGVVEFIAEKENLTPKEVLNVLNKESGLKGLTGYSDMRTVHEKALEGDEKSKLAMDVYADRVVSYIGAYYVKSSAEAIVFTAGVGQGAHYIREKICEKLDALGVVIDKDLNSKNPYVTETIEISMPCSKLRVFVIPANEELMIAKESYGLLK